MTSYFAFLASPFATEEMVSLRSKIYVLGQERNLAVWVAEMERKDLAPESGAAPLEIADVCMEAVRQSEHFILIADGSFGTALTHTGQTLASSFIEMEIFQAALLEKPVHIFRYGEISPDSQLGRLLQMLRSCFGQHIDQDVRSPDGALRAIDHLMTESTRRRWLPFGHGRSRAYAAALATRRHQDWENLRLGVEIGFLKRFAFNLMHIQQP